MEAPKCACLVARLKCYNLLRNEIMKWFVKKDQENLKELNNMLESVRAECIDIRSELKLIEEQIFKASYEIRRYLNDKD